MPTSVLRRGALALSFLAPSLASAQGPVIDHKDVACIVVGEYARLNACFTPASPASPASLVARARAYFRPETLPTWYHVVMTRDATTSDARCHVGVLPKPMKMLVGKKVYYYLEALDRDSRSGQTAEFAPIVVESAEECREKGIVAPLSATGPTAVLPFMPAGFGGGAALSTAVLGGGVAVAAVTVGAIAISRNDDSPTPTVTLDGGPTLPTPPPATTPPPPTSEPSRPPSLVITCTATPRSGDAPLRVAFATFANGGDGTYEYSWSFADGGSSTNPNPSHTYVTPGVFPATVRVTSAGLVASCTRDITVTAPPTPGPPPTTTPTPSPSPSASPSASPSPITFTLVTDVTGTGTGTITGPGINCPGDCTETYPSGTVVSLTATPASPPPSVFKQWTGDCTGTTNPCVLTMSANKNVVAQFELIRTLSVTGGFNSDIAGSVTSNPAGITCTWGPAAPCSTSAPFVNGTTVTLTVVTVGARVVWAGACAGASGNVCTLLMDADKAVIVDSFRTFQAAPKTPAGPLAWSAQLDVPGAEGRISVNGGAGTATGVGRSTMSTERRRGANLVEAVLSRSAGRPGTWRFEFAGAPGVRRGSLTVHAGTVAVVTEDAVVFNLQGRTGERVVFTFEVEP